MPARLWLFVRKEARQHGPVALALAVAMPLLFLLTLVGVAVSPETVTHLEAHRMFLVGMVTLMAVALGNRLVVAEYQGHTQLFLEALPIRRLEPLAVKYALGLAALLAVAAFSLAGAALVAARTEPLGGRFLALVAARTVAWLLALWSAVFALGLLGRLRVFVYVLAGAAAAMLSATTDLEIGRAGPFPLVGQAMVLDRAAVPWAALAWALGLALGFATLAVALATLREGSLAEALSQRMTAREKVTVGLLAVAWLIAQTELDKRATKAPLRFEGAAVLRSEREAIEVMYAPPAARPAGQALMTRLEGDLGALRRTLGWAALPPVRVALRESLDGATFEPVELATADGVLVRANFAAAEGYDPTALVAVVIGRVLDHHTADRARFEPRRWVRDGFARWWAVRDEPAARRPLELRAAWAAGRVAAGGDTLRRWTLAREALGEPVSEALAWSALDALAAARGEAAVARLARRVYGRRPHQDVRELFYEHAHPMAREVADATGEPFDALTGLWARRLAALRADPAVRAALGAVDGAAADVAVARGPGQVRGLTWRLAGAPAGTTRAALLHLDLGPFEHPLDEPDLQRDERVRAPDGAWDLGLRGRYGAGTRLFVALELDAPPLGCPVRLGARRLELP